LRVGGIAGITTGLSGYILQQDLQHFRQFRQILAEAAQVLSSGNFSQALAQASQQRAIIAPLRPQMVHAELAELGAVEARFHALGVEPAHLVGFASNLPSGPSSLLGL